MPGGAGAQHHGAMVPILLTIVTVILAAVFAAWLTDRRDKQAGREGRSDNLLALKRAHRRRGSWQRDRLQHDPSQPRSHLPGHYAPGSSVLKHPRRRQ